MNDQSANFLEFVYKFQAFRVKIGACPRHWKDKLTNVLRLRVRLVGCPRYISQ